MVAYHPRVHCSGITVLTRMPSAAPSDRRRTQESDHGMLGGDVGDHVGVAPREKVEAVMTMVPPECFIARKACLRRNHVPRTLTATTLSNVSTE